MDSISSFDGPEPPHSGSDDIWHYIGVLRRRWWLVAATAVVAIAAAWWMQRGDYPDYTAEVLLQQRSAGSTMGVGMPGIGAMVDFGSHLDILRSQEVLGPVVQEMGLQLLLRNHEDERSRVLGMVVAERAPPPASYEFYEQEDGRRALVLKGQDEPISVVAPGEVLKGPGFWFHVSDLSGIDDRVEFVILDIDRAYDLLKRQLQIQEGAGMDLIRVRYRSPDAELAADLVNSVANSYQQNRARRAQEEAARTRRVITDQLVLLADSLRAVEDAVMRYQSQERLLNPDVEGNALLNELFATRNELSELRFGERLLEGAVAALENATPDTDLQQITGMIQDLVPGAGALISELRGLELQRGQLTASRFGLTSSDPQVEQIDSQIRTIRAAIAGSARQALDLQRRRIGEAAGREGRVLARVGDLPSRTSEYERLQQRAQAVQDAYDRLVNKYFDAQIAEGIEAGDIEIVGPAPIPVRPDPSRRGLRLTIAMLAGFLVGCVGVLLLDQLDASIRRPFDAERIAQLQVIGMIPSVRAHGTDLPTAQLGKEAFRALRTHLRFSATKKPQVVSVTSPTPREGKSTVAGNLAITMMEQGASTILVDADMRRPQVHTTFGVPQSPGLADVLAGDATLDQAIRTQGAGRSALRILPAGSGGPNPTELVGSEAFTDLLTELRRRFESIVIDTPPLLAVTDAALIGAVVDGTVIVVRANRTDEASLKSAVSQLRRLGVPLLGIVLNGVSVGRSGYAYYPSYHSYDEPKQEKPRKRIMLKSGTRDG